MANKEEAQATATRGADWEVVSLTASTYAAAPDVNMPEPKGKEKGDVADKDKVETSNALFMSGHFVLPPNQLENLPLEPENTEIPGEQGGEDDVSESVKRLVGKLDAKEEQDRDLKMLTESEDFHGIQFSDEKSNKLALIDVDFAETTILSGLNLARKEQIVYGSPTDDEIRVLAESVQSSDAALGSNIQNASKKMEEDNHDGSDIPYAAWWKKQAASLYAQAKGTNTFWSIFVAAAVMGLVVIGQQWQQERWQVLHHDWKSGINDEFFEPENLFNEFMQITLYNTSPSIFKVFLLMLTEDGKDNRSDIPIERRNYRCKATRFSHWSQRL